MIAESYGHTLIPRSNDAVPTAAQVERFAGWVIAHGVVPGIPQVFLTVVRGYQEVPDPFTGGMRRIPKRDRRRIELNQIAESAASLVDYEISFGDRGFPKLPPLPLPDDVPGDFHVETTIVVSSMLRSTSDTYNGFAPPPIEMPMFGTPCETPADVGYFSNMHTGGLIKVPGAGSARFWIEFELGSFVFPPIHDHLNLLAPEIVQEAERIFGIEFVQGLHWGA
jgi:hypothetical protein